MHHQVTLTLIETHQPEMSSGPTGMSYTGVGTPFGGFKCWISLVDNLFLPMGGKMYGEQSNP